MREVPSQRYNSNLEEESFIQFRYQIEFRPKVSGMFLWVFLGDENITRFEQYGIHALKLHPHQLPQSELDPEHRRFVQHLLHFADLNTSEGYFFVPKKHVAFFLPKLGRFPEVEFFTDDKKVNFSEESLNPKIFLEEQSPQRVSLTATLQVGESENEIPLSQGRFYAGRRSWFVAGDTLYPIKMSPLTDLLEQFSLEGSLVLQGHEAADFIQDYLPLLSKKPQVVLPKDFSMPEVLQGPGKAVYDVSEAGDKLVLEIQFSYLDHLIPPHRHDEEVLVSVPSEAGRTLLVRRDIAYEKEVLHEFTQQGFQRVGETRFETLGDAARQFISENLDTMKAEGTLTGEQSLKNFKWFGEISADQIRAKALGSTGDWLSLDLTFEIDGQEIPYEVIRSLYAEGKQYLEIPDKGFVKINLESIRTFEEKLAEVEGDFTDQGRLKISRYHAAFLDETLKIDWSENVRIGEIVASLREMSQIPNAPLPEGLQAKLREYQQHGYDWLKFLHRYQFHGILADDMGLGKTVQALSYLLSTKNDSKAPHLVIVPTSVIFNWIHEAKKFTPDLKVIALTGSKRKELYSQLAEQDLIITSYAVFRRDVEILNKMQWSTVILDEAQNIKNFRSKTAAWVKSLQAEQRWALSGTPLENRLSELWSIFDFLMPGFLGKYAHFQKKYQVPIETHHSAEHLERLRKRIYPFVLRRLKDEVAKELPPKTEITNYCEMTAPQQKLYEQVLAACRRDVLSEVEKKGVERSQISILTALLRLRQVCCDPRLLGADFHKKNIPSGKMEAFQDLMLEILEEGHRVLVFSQFVEMLGLLKGWLEEAKIPYEYLDGRTRNREERVRRFNEDDKIPVFLVSLRAGGIGLNLTGASYVIHYDPWWNPAIQDQATDRVHRIGQKKHVFSYKLITKDSVEEKILILQEKKRGLAKGLLSADSGFGKVLTQEDLEFLFA